MRIIWHGTPINTPARKLYYFICGCLVFLIKVIFFPVILFFVLSGQCSLSFNNKKNV